MHRVHKENRILIRKSAKLAFPKQQMQELSDHLMSKNEAISIKNVLHMKKA